jgi:hypothetical protein
VKQTIQPPPPLNLHSPRSASSPAPNVVDIFCSFRIAEAENEALQVVTQLRSRFGLNAVMINNVLNGGNIARQVSEAIVAAKLVIIFGTRTYGQATQSPCSTDEELAYIMEHKRDSFFWIKMCETFACSSAVFSLTNRFRHTRWLSGEDMPSGLIEEIVAKFRSLQ